MVRRRRTDEKLQAASDHLHYELSMFKVIAEALATGVFGAGPIKNAVLEAFALHARVLLDFLFLEDPREDDVVAGDFLADQDWPNIRGEIPPILKKARERVGKEIAHLTYVRLDVKPEDKPWPFLEIASAMETMIERFIRAVPKARLGAKWQSYAADDDA